MTDRRRLLGRDAELAQLAAAMQRARDGAGGVVLVSGDAGVGKSRLIAEVVGREADALVLGGAAGHTGGAPYGPVVAALRAGLRARPGALDPAAPLMAHLAMLLPELGKPAASSNRATLV